jgi:O-antigen/teichoic acid export membrane protein
MRFPFADKILKNEFYRNVATLLSGSAIAQAIPILIMPVLTRIYPTEVFGIFFIYSSMILVLTIISTLEYELAIVLPEKDEEAINVFALSIIVAFIISLLILGVVTLFFDSICNLLGDKNIGEWLYFIPLSVLLVGIYQALNFWNNRKKKYKVISYSKVAKTTTSGSVQFGSGVAGYTGIGLIGGLISGQFIAAVFIYFKTIKEIRDLWKHVSFPKIITQAKKYKEIPLFNTVIDGLNTLSNQLPVFLIARFFGVQMVSFYGLANRVITTPMGLIGQSVGQVFYKEASDIFNSKRDFYGFIKKTYIRLFKIGIIPFALLALLSPIVFSLIFGEEWELAGTFTQILVPWLFIAFLNSPITHIVTILTRQKQIVVYDILLFVVRFASLYVGYKFYNDVYIAIILYSLTGLLFNIFLLFYFLRISKSVKFEN